MVENTNTKQTYDLKSIQVEPDNIADSLKLSKGIVRLHSAYNERFKFMNSQMTFLEEVLSGQKYGIVSNKIVYNENTIMKLRKIWRGGLKYEITRDPLRPNLIIKREIVYNEENLNPNLQHFDIPALEELSPLDHVNDNGLFIEMTEEIPVKLAWNKLKLEDINSQWYRPRYFTYEEIDRLPLTRVTYYWGKPFFFSLIKQLRTLWNKYYYEIMPLDHEVIRETKYSQTEKEHSGYGSVSKL